MKIFLVVLLSAMPAALGDETLNRIDSDAAAGESGSIRAAQAESADVTPDREADASGIKPPKMEWSPSPGEEYDPRHTMHALNSAIVSTFRVVHTKDPVVLDHEYGQIVEQLKIASISADHEIKDLFSALMDFLTAKKLNAEKRQRFEAAYDRTRDRALYESLAGIRAYGADPLSFSLSLAQNAISAYFGFSTRKDDLQEQLGSQFFELDTESVERANDLYTRLLQASWTLQRRYTLPDEWRLTEDVLRQYVRAQEAQDPDLALREFQRLQGYFAAYPPFWFQWGHRFQQTGQLDHAARCYRIFEQGYVEIWRHDPHVIDIAVRRYFLERDRLDPAEKRALLARAKSHVPPDNPDPYQLLGLAAAYQDLGELDLARECVQINIDRQNRLNISVQALDNLDAGKPLATGIYELLKVVANTPISDGIRLPVCDDCSIDFDAMLGRANAGDMDAAALYVSCAVVRGCGFAATEEDVFRLLNVVAGHDVAEANFALAWGLMLGEYREVIQESEAKIEQLILKHAEKAAFSGIRMANYLLGTCYLSGIGVPRDIGRGRQLLLDAAEGAENDSIRALAHSELADLELWPKANLSVEEHPEAEEHLKQLVYHAKEALKGARDPNAFLEERFLLLSLYLRKRDQVGISRMMAIDALTPLQDLASEEPYFRYLVKIYPKILDLVNEFAAAREDSIFVERFWVSDKEITYEIAGKWIALNDKQVYSSDGLSFSLPALEEDDIKWAPGLFFSSTLQIKGQNFIPAEETEALFLRYLILLASDLSKQLPAAGGADEDGVRAIVNNVKKALESLDVDLLLAQFAEDFNHPQVGGLDQARPMFQMALDSGYADDLEVSLDDVMIEFEDGKAIVYPIDLSSPAGAVAVELTLEKRGDKWAIVSLDVDGL